MAGILPGLLMSLLFIAAIWIVTVRDPAKGPKGEALPFAQRFALFLKAAPLLGVILVSIGGIYLGVFTPVEASGIEAGLVIVLALVTGKLNRVGFTKAIADTVKTSAMLYMIVVGANVLNPFLAITDIPLALSEMLTHFGLGPYRTLVLILLSCVVLGMFLDGLAMLVVTIPIYYPVILGLGFDPIWFGVIAVIVIEMGMITPPVGLNVFVVRGVAGDVPLATVFAGVLPFLLAMIATLLLIIAIPGIAL